MFPPIVRHFTLCLTASLLAVVATLVTAHAQDAASKHNSNLEAGIAAFVNADCATAIPLLTQAVHQDSNTDDLILITQVLSACLASTGDIERARILMRQLTPLVMADRGVHSKALLEHNLTWAEFELGVGERINAANRITEGLTNYLGGRDVAADNALRALAAYSAVMVAQNEVARFENDLALLLEQDASIKWDANGGLGKQLEGLPVLDGTLTQLAGWSLLALERTTGVSTFQALLRAAVQGTL